MEEQDPRAQSIIGLDKPRGYGQPARTFPWRAGRPSATLATMGGISVGEGRVIAGRADVEALAREHGFDVKEVDDAKCSVAKGLGLLRRMGCQPLPPWDSPDQIVFRLREASRRRGVSPAALAAALKTSRQTASRLRSGMNRPTFDHACAWAGFLEDLGLPHLRLRVFMVGRPAPTDDPGEPPAPHPGDEPTDAPDVLAVETVQPDVLAVETVQPDVLAVETVQPYVLAVEAVRPPAVEEPGPREPEDVVGTCNAREGTPDHDGGTPDARHGPREGADGTQNARDGADGTQNARDGANGTQNAQDGAVTQNARIIAPKKSKTPRKQHLTGGGPVLQLEGAMFRVEWKMNGKPLFGRDVPVEEIEAVKRGMVSDLANPLYKGAIPYINGERFDPTLYRLEAQIEALAADHVVVRQAVTAMNANFAAQRADFMTMFDVIGQRLLELGESCGAGAPPARLLELLERLVQRTVDANDKVKKE
ncbi:MAG: helix-turn-helix transcriptional regulator [Nannocystaceae bacterium]